MKAIAYQRSHAIDHPEALLDIELPTPVAEGRDLLVKVKAVSVNPVDTKVRKRAEPEAGGYKVLGWDVAGEVIAVGEAVSRFKVGDAVWYAGDVTRPGGNAEFHLVDERIVGHQPSSVSSAEAAAVPLTAITAWELLFDRLRFERLAPQQPGSSPKGGRSLLIVGAAGGVGSILTQLASRLTDATVIGTASRPDSQAWVKSLGADCVVDHRQPLAAELRRIGLNQVTDVISLTHTDQHFDQLVEALAPQGQLALIDDPAQPLDVMKLKHKCLSLHWEMMFTRAMFGTEDMHQQGELLDAVSKLIDDGVLKTTLGEHYGLINADNLKRAHAFIEGGSAIGKVVLEGFY